MTCLIERYPQGEKAVNSLLVCVCMLADDKAALKSVIDYNEAPIPILNLVCTSVSGECASINPNCAVTHL